jgi:TRAP-type uncharacterized transport system fused permease subunit
MYTYIIHNITNGSNTFRKGTANPQIIAQSYFEGTAGFTRYIFNIYIYYYTLYVFTYVLYTALLTPIRKAVYRIAAQASAMNPFYPPEATAWASGGDFESWGVHVESMWTMCFYGKTIGKP